MQHESRPKYLLVARNSGIWWSLFFSPFEFQSVTVNRVHHEITMKPDEFKAWRIRFGFTQAVAAKRLHVTTRTVKFWEAGDRPVLPRVQHQMHEISRRRTLYCKKGENYDPARDRIETPRELFNRLDQEFNFDLDAAATAGNAKVAKFISPDQDALSLPWRGNAFVNPPYNDSRVGEWVEHAWRQSLIGCPVVVLLLPSGRTDNRWWCDIVVGHASEIRYVHRRLWQQCLTAVVVFRQGQDGPPRVSVMRKPNGRPWVPEKNSGRNANGRPSTGIPTGILHLGPVPGATSPRW
jgi:phage N-6-adenine-methyltransferase